MSIEAALFGTLTKEIDGKAEAGVGDPLQGYRWRPI
jgi:hypothetical protein